MVGIQELDPSWFQMVVYFVSHKLLLFVCLHYVPPISAPSISVGAKMGANKFKNLNPYLVIFLDPERKLVQ
jgi:hypothetical protein